MIRKCQSGYKIGPLFANNYNIASELLNSLIDSIPENIEFFLDIPELNNEALKLAGSNDMTYVFETARMYTKEAPKINLQKVFGITTFEVG